MISDKNKVFLAIFSSTFGTHFAYDNQIPTEFEEACPSEKVPNKKRNEMDGSGEPPIR